MNAQFWQMIIPLLGMFSQGGGNPNTLRQLMEQFSGSSMFNSSPQSNPGPMSGLVGSPISASSGSGSIGMFNQSSMPTFGNNIPNLSTLFAGMLGMPGMYGGH